MPSGKRAARRERSQLAAQHRQVGCHHRSAPRRRQPPVRRRRPRRAARRDAVVLQTRNLIVGVLNAEGRTPDPSRVEDNPVKQLHRLTRLERAGDWIDDGWRASSARTTAAASICPAWEGEGGGMQTEIFVPALRQLPGPTPGRYCVTSTTSPARSPTSTPI